MAEHGCTLNNQKVVTFWSQSWGIRLGSWPPWVTYKDPVLKSQESHIYFSTCLFLTSWLLSQCLAKELMRWEPGSPKWTTVARETDRVRLQNCGWLPCVSEGRGSELGNRDVRLSPFDLDLSIYFAQNQVSDPKAEMCLLNEVYSKEGNTILEYNHL